MRNLRGLSACVAVVLAQVVAAVSQGSSFCEESAGKEATAAQLLNYRIAIGTNRHHIGERIKMNAILTNRSTRKLAVRESALRKYCNGKLPVKQTLQNSTPGVVEASAGRPTPSVKDVVGRRGQVGGEAVAVQDRP